MMIMALILVIFVIGVRAETNNGSCKEILQGYLTGQLSSALGTYQLEALKREFKSFTDHIENSVKAIKERSEKPKNSSIVYTRWGKKTCPSNAELVLSARKTCYKGWKLEYHGYLMAGYYKHPAGTMYTCVDEHPDTLHGGHADKDGRLLYHVEARCGSLKCPPYVAGRELVCAICSKE